METNDERITKLEARLAKTLELVGEIAQQNVEQARHIIKLTQISEGITGALSRLTK